MADLVLSPKYKAFLGCHAPVEFLEGTTAAGKTTVGAFKFMLRVAESEKTQHILSGLDTGTIEKNIITKDLGILDVFGSLVEYNPAGRGAESLPHLLLHTARGDKIIYILGYDNKARWKKALGGQYGCLYIDEINVADMDYVREAAMRCDYLLATLNPDNPDLPVYKEYINKARPLPRYADDAPPELTRMLNEPPVKGWAWWYFDMDDNAGLTEEKKRQIRANVPPGTKIYKNKILGLRGRSSGLVFSNYDESVHTVTEAAVKALVKGKPDAFGRLSQTEYFVQFSAGCDTAYSRKSPDTIALSYIGMTNRGRCLVLSEKVYNNRDLEKPIAPSDTVVQLVAFLDRCGAAYGRCQNVYIDSADAATLQECAKYKRMHGCLYQFVPAWKKEKIIDRIQSQLGWFAHGLFLVSQACPVYRTELQTYSWKPDADMIPEDGNDHMINSVQYAFIPYQHLIGER